MIVNSKVITQPTSEPVTLDEAKTHLRVDGDDEDTYITSLIKVARIMCEAYSGLSFLTQTREIKLDYFPCARSIEIPNGPVQSVDDFVYVDSDGNSVAMVDGTDYRVDLHSDIARVQAVSSWPTNVWPTPGDQFNSVSIAYTAGYTNDDHDPLPEVIKQAILMQVGSLYENRQDEVVGSMGHMINVNSQMLLDTVKVYHNANA